MPTLTSALQFPAMHRPAIRKAVFCLVTLVASIHAQTSSADLQKTLRHRFEGNVVQLRIPSKSPHQHYDNNGMFVGDPQPGAWTLYDRIRIDHVRIKGDALKIEGTRTAVSFDTSNSGKMSEIRTQGPVELDIDVAPGSSESSVNAAIDRVLLQNQTELLDIAPDFWRPYLRYALGIDPSLQVPANPQAFNLDRDKSIQAPVPLDNPNPQYSPEARTWHVQGKTVLRGVVEADGSFDKLVVWNPIGWGLDENAVAAAKNWRFKPAMKGGSPVAVAVAVEMSFHLFQ